MIQSLSQGRPCVFKVLSTVLLLAVLNERLSAVDVTAKTPEVSLHGSLEHLQHSLVESGDQGRLLELAKRQLELGHRDIAFEALLELFAQPSDAFTPVAAGGASASTHRTAVQLLQMSGNDIRFAWSRSVEPLAAIAMKQAKGDAEAVISIARRFPLTPTGMQALTTRSALAQSRGQFGLAEAIHEELQTLYIDKPSFGLNGRLPDNSLSKELTMIARMAGGTANVTPDQLTLPWPDPLWSWKESIWRVPAASVFGGVNLPENRALFSVNTWQPVLAENTIFLRTPVRILAFDKHSGKVEWSLYTDTVKSASSLDELSETLLLQGSTSLAEILQMENLGTVAVSGQHVFFIDHFRKFSETYNTGQFNSPPLRQRKLEQLLRSRGSSEEADGRRLVALRMQPKPEIAWSVGDCPDFDYRFSEMPPQPRKLSKTLGEEFSGDVLPSEFEGQKFCGVPLVHDQMLFVLSSDDEVVRLNCLTESTGRLLWKKSLVYNNDGNGLVQERFAVNYEQAQNASLCGVDKQTIICALNGGVVIGASVVDGQLLWATSVRDIEEDSSERDSQRRLFSAISITARPIPTIRSQPVLLPGRMIWSAPFCSTVQCLDTLTGEIIWTVPRSVAAVGELEGSVDDYAIAATNGQVIMIGPRHIRALKSVDGTQQWVAPVLAQSGRAFCSRDTCLVPLIDGTLAQFDLETGRRATTSSVAAGLEKLELVGTVVADDDVVCVAGPIAISVLPTTDAFRRNTESLRPITGNSVATQLDLARAELISGRIANGILALNSLLDERPDLTVNDEITELLSETLLSLLGSGNSVERDAEISNAEISAQLQRLPLTVAQQIRHAILQPAVALDYEEENIFAASTRLRLEPDWSARADVAAWGMLRPINANRVSSFHEADELSLSQIQHAILFPEHTGTVERLLGYAKQLVADQQPVAAELLLLSAYANADTDQKTELSHSIIRLRESFVSVAVTHPSPFVPKKWEIEIEEAMSLTSGSQVATALGVARRLADVPDWYDKKLFLANRDIIATDMTAGVITHSNRLPASGDPVALDQAFEMPSILPLASAGHVGVVSLLNADGPKLLWWKRVDRPASDVSSIEVGPFGPSYLTVTTGSQLMCFHPLTGQVLWTRKASIDTASQSVFQRALRVVGDSEVTAMLGQNLKSCEVFRTQDGKRLAPVFLDIPRGQTPLVSGRCLLFQKDQKLILIDLLTGTNLLETEPELRVLGAGQARKLSDHRAVTLTDKLDLVVLNLQTAKTELKVSVADIVQPELVVGMTAFERDGKLFVLLKDWNTARSQRSASSKIGDIRLDSGILCCINVASGGLLWHRDIDPCVVPKIYGDATPLMISWAFQHPQYIWEQRLGRGRNRGDDALMDEQSSLILTIVDSETGNLVVEQKNLSRAEPLRCVHNADRRVITLDTDTSVISVKYGG